jgi:Dolichyl-phosphate-mannose-protein mannosyltransferase
MDATTLPLTRTTGPVLVLSDRFSMSRVAVTASALVAVIVIAFGLRAAHLATYGFSEDEINKVRAVEQYRHGQLRANGEHPMLMKLAMLTSVEAARGWNRIAAVDSAIPMEAAIRLPNALVGAATAAALFGVCNVLFGTPVALMAALLWAFDVNAIAINRIGKEDTFALFFFLTAVWSYERAKRQGATDAAGAQRWYTASGAAFGLMLASKYFPQYLGLYALFNTLTDRAPGKNRPDPLRYYGAMVIAFVIANVTILDPATWRYCIDYVGGGTLVHHGYPYAGRLYVNTGALSLDGVPPTFYLRLLGTKVPLVVLGASVPGVIEVLRRRRERGFVLLTMCLGLLLVGYSVPAVKFMRYALPLFAFIDMLAAIGVVAGIGWLLRKLWLLPTTRVTVAAVALTVCIAGPFLAQQVAAPFPSLFRNAIGERLAPAGAAFPEEAYDYGVREAVSAIAAVAAPGDVIVSDAPGVVAYYLEGSGRGDLGIRSLSAEGLPGNGRAFVIVQPEHLTFENREAVTRLQRDGQPWRQFYAGDALTAQVFRHPRS